VSFTRQKTTEQEKKNTKVDPKAKQPMVSGLLRGKALAERKGTRRARQTKPNLQGRAQGGKGVGRAKNNTAGTGTLRKNEDHRKGETESQKAKQIRRKKKALIKKSIRPELISQIPLDSQSTNGVGK